MIHVAFLWHLHQPCYRDLFSGEGSLPWVRLHGTKDYYGMGAVLRDRPHARATFNWVPVLVEQLRALIKGEYVDRPLRVARKSADSLEEEEAVYMLRAFFRANHERMIYPFGRYGDLLDKRGEGVTDLKRKVRKFSVEDLRDLQVWANLAWFHESLQRNDPLVSGLIRKGSRFTEEEKEALLSRQMEVLKEVLELYRGLATSGQIELTTSPYYHPILPLLVNMESARQAMPGVPLPSIRGPYAGDARLQLTRGADLIEEVFGTRPKGLWPSEGSVSEDIVPLVAEAGFEWMASDEGILGRSLGVDLARDATERIVKPHVLYRPYRIEAGGGAVNMVFRDRILSDLFGFKYQHMGARQAVADFVGRLGRIQDLHRGAELLVTVILDGENPWESYPGGGLDFLSLLYSRLAEEESIRTTTISEYLDGHTEPQRLDRLFAGSWIDSNFSVWIGSGEDNLAWEALGRAHAFLEREASRADPASLEKARESLLAAQGSDWFWWYGDRFSCDEDDDFDTLFRTHLLNVYRFLGAPLPEDLSMPLVRTRRKVYTAPDSFLRVRLDGCLTHYFEWAGAGTYDPGRDYTSMGPSIESTVSALYFGFDGEALLLRADLLPSAGEFFASGGDVRIQFPGRKATAVLIRRGDGLGGELVFAPHARKGSPGKPFGAWSAGKILEISIPCEKIGSRAGEVVVFRVSAVRRGRVLDRFPRAGAFEITVPSEDFETETWFV